MLVQSATNFGTGNLFLIVRVADLLIYRFYERTRRNQQVFVDVTVTLSGMRSEIHLK